MSLLEASLTEKKPTLYAMVGTIGSGKTTFAKKLANEKTAVFFSIDSYIKTVAEVSTKEEYDKYYNVVRDLIAQQALDALSMGVSVVLDFGGSVGHWDWLSDLARKGNANIEIFHLLAPFLVRKQRILNRNRKSDVVFQFTDKEIDAMPRVSATPEVNHPGLKITVIDTAAAELTLH